MMNRSERKRRARQAKKQQGPLGHAYEERCGSEDDKVQLISEIMPTPPRQAKSYCKPDDTPWWKELLEIGTLAVGVCAVIVYKGQWDAAKTANDINTDNAKAQQRAWVGLDITDTDNPFTVGQDGYASTWLLHFKNFGNSPALHLKLHSRMYIISEPSGWKQAQRDIEGLDLSQDFDGALFNGARTLNFGKSEIYSNPHFIEAIRTGTIVMAVGTRVSYYDIFGKHHETTTCVAYGKPTIYSLGTWGICPIQETET